MFRSSPSRVKVRFPTNVARGGALACSIRAEDRRTSSAALSVVGFCASARATASSKVRRLSGERYFWNERADEADSSPQPGTANAKMIAVTTENKLPGLSIDRPQHRVRSRWIVLQRHRTRGEAIEQGVQRRYQKQGEESRDGEAADHRAGQGQVGLASLADAQGHWNEPENGGDGGHQNGPEPGFPRFHGGFQQRLAAPAQDVGEIH